LKYLANSVVYSVVLFAQEIDSLTAQLIEHVLRAGSGLHIVAEAGQEHLGADLLGKLGRCVAPGVTNGTLAVWKIVPSARTASESVNPSATGTLSWLISWLAVEANDRRVGLVS